MQEARSSFPPAVAAAALVSLTSFAACTVSTEQPNLKGQDVHLTVIHTADIHSRLFPYQFAPGQIDKALGLVPAPGETVAMVGGIARIASVVKSIRSSSERVLHVDSGDVYEGAPVFNYFQGEVEMKAMSRLGVDAMALGNHEFDKGAVNLELMKSKFGNFPILAANYIFTDPGDPTQPKLSKVISPFTIVNAHGLKIAIVGMGNLSSLQGIFEGGNSLGIRPVKTIDVIRNTVQLLRPNVDLLFLVTHLGLDVDEALAQSMSQECPTGAVCTVDADCNGRGRCDASGQCLTTKCDENAQAAIEGVDVIFGGHLHIVLNPPNQIPHSDGTYTVVCHSGAFAKYVGRLDLQVHVGDPAATTPKDRNTHVTTYTYDLTPIDDRIDEDPEMARMLLPYETQLNAALNLSENFAVVPCPASSATCPKIQRNDPNGGDSQLGNMVATAMRLRRRVEAEFGLTNSLGIRADFESGPLNVEEMFNVFPFDNTITTMFLSGGEIQEMLDFLAARASERGCRSQAQVSGLWYVSDCSHAVSCGPFDAAGNRATQCHSTDRLLGPTDPRRKDGPPLVGDDCINHPDRCRPVLPFGSYRVAVNDYIANGGSGFAVLKRNTTKYNTGISLRDALTDYLRNVQTRCSPTDLDETGQPRWQDNTLLALAPVGECMRDAECASGRRCSGAVPSVQGRPPTRGLCTVDGKKQLEKAPSCTMDAQCPKGQRCFGGAYGGACRAPNFDYSRLPCLLPEGVPGAIGGHDDRIRMVAP